MVIFAFFKKQTNKKISCNIYLEEKKILQVSNSTEGRAERCQGQLFTIPLDSYPASWANKTPTFVCEKESSKWVTCNQLLLNRNPSKL